MSSGATITRSSYEIHGTSITVETDSRAVLDAMSLRLRDFRSESVRDPDLRLEFIAGGGGPVLTPEGARPVYDTPYGSLHYLPGEDALCGRLRNVRLRCEASRGVASFYSSSFTGRDLYLATHPLATIALMELLERRGLFALHAACLAEEDGRGVLIAGASGAGKSTLALALTRAGMGFLSDDIVFLTSDATRGSVRALGFADGVGLTGHVADYFDDLGVLLTEPPAAGFPKRLHRIEDLFDTRGLPFCEPRALVFPEVTPNQPSRIDPIDPSDALLCLVPDVLLTEPKATEAHLRAIAALLGQVRCYALRSGTELERTAARIRALA